MPAMRMTFCPSRSCWKAQRRIGSTKPSPVLRRFQKVYLAVYDAFLDLKRAYDSLKKELERALGRISTLEATIDHMIEERAEKAVTIDKYNTLCRAHGREYIEDRVREIREKEHQERQLKKARSGPGRDI